MLTAEGDGQNYTTFLALRAGNVAIGLECGDAQLQEEEHL